MLLLSADCGWNVTKAISSCHPAVAAIAVPSAASTSQHCVVSSSPSTTRHGAVTQDSALRDSEVTSAVVQPEPVTKNLTEQGRLA